MSAQWNVDNSHSSITFSVRHMVISKVRGKFTSWTAEVAYDETDVTKSSVRAEVEVASIDTGVGDRDAHLRSADFFDAANHPKMVFVGKTVERTGGAEFKLHGNLTIRGTTLPVVLAAETTGATKDPWGLMRTGFAARTSVDRHAFGLHWNQLLETGGMIVGDKVDIEIEVELVRPA